MQQYQVELNNKKTYSNNQIADIVSALLNKLTAWKKLSSHPDEVTMLTNSIEAYQFESSIPDYAVVTMTFYFKDKIQGVTIDDQITKIAKKHTNSKIQIRIQKGGGRSPLIESKNSYKFFNHIQQIAKKMEVKVEPVLLSYSSDISLAAENIPAVEGFGPLGNNCGSADEFIIRDSLIDRSALLAMVIYACSSKV
jgi:D-alanine-D-alanine ligase